MRSLIIGMLVGMNVAHLIFGCSFQAFEYCALNLILVVQLLKHL